MSDKAIAAASVVSSGVPLEGVLSVLVIILCTVMYLLMGFGVARMMAKINSKEVSLFDFIAWPIVCGVFAAAGRCESP
jgi:uncharacterized membrane protein YkvI